MGVWHAALWLCLLGICRLLLHTPFTLKGTYLDICGWHGYQIKPPPPHAMFNTCQTMLDFSLQALVQATISSTLDVYAYQAIAAGKFHGVACTLYETPNCGWWTDCYLNNITEALQINVNTNHEKYLMEAAISDMLWYSSTSLLDLLVPHDTSRSIDL